MPRHPLVVLALIVVPAVLAACGEDDSPERGLSKTEAAFLEGMIPHHESAVDMAEIAQERAEHREVEKLAAAIVDAQTAEISQMEEIYERIEGEEIVPDPDAHGSLGLSQREAGMHETDAVMLEKATRAFDKAFIDAMIPHHQGAIRQAHILLADTGDPELEKLADAIIDAQSSEIRQMNGWRKRWFGAPSPAGGVPSVDDLPPTSGDHDGEH